MKIDKQILSKNKCFAIIDSCIISDQFEIANNCIDLYLKIYNDNVGYEELKKYLNEKKNFNNC